MVSAPRLSGHPGARAYANAEGPEPVVKRLVERRPVDMPSMPEGVVHELGHLDVGRAPGAAVAEGGSMLLEIENWGTENVLKQPVGTRRQALAGSRPKPARCT